jgi:hypothetical protein
MSVSSKENQSHDFQVEQAIAEGKLQAAEVESEVEITVEFTDAQQQMIVELTKALTLSVDVLLESAISYVYYKSKKNREFVDKIEEYYQQKSEQSDVESKQIKRSSKHGRPVTKKLTLAAETSHKLQELGMQEKANACAIAGINLLYNQLN